MEISFNTGTGRDTSIEPSAGHADEGFTYTPGAEDMSLPFIRLAQGLTAEVAAGAARPGQWILPDGSLTDTIEATIIGMRRTRVLRADQDIVCRSDDAVIGHGDPGGDCSQCPLAMWSGNDERRIPPSCTLNYQYLVEYGDDETGGIGVISMSTRSASKVAAQVNMYVKMHGIKNTRVTLKSTLVVKGTRKFHTPVLVKAGSVQLALADPTPTSASE